MDSNNNGGVMTIALELDKNEVDLVLTALGQLPFVRVVALIQKIDSQAVAQLNPPKEG